MCSLVLYCLYLLIYSYNQINQLINKCWSHSSRSPKMTITSLSASVSHMSKSPLVSFISMKSCLSSISNPIYWVYHLNSHLNPHRNPQRRYIIMISIFLLYIWRSWIRRSILKILICSRMFCKTKSHRNNKRTNKKERSLKL